MFSVTHPYAKQGLLPSTKPLKSQQTVHTSGSGAAFILRRAKRVSVPPASNQQCLCVDNVFKGHPGLAFKKNKVIRLVQVLRRVEVV